MKKFFKNNWGRIILFLILIVICILSFSKGKYLLGNDNYSPELNPSLTVERSLKSPSWRSYRVFGYGSESEQADVFRAIFFEIVERFIPQNVCGQVFGVLCLFVGTFFMGELAGLIIKDFVDKKYYQVGILLGGIIYVSTLWTAWTFYQNLAPFTSNFGFLPLLLFVMYLYIKSPSSQKAFLLFITSILFTSSCVIATLFVSDLLLIIPFSVFLVFAFRLEKIERIRRLKNTFLIFLTTQLFWILPFIFYTFSNSSNLVDSYINRSITASIIDLESEMQTLVNSSRFYTRILTDVRNGKYVFPLALDYQEYDFYKVAGLLPIVVSLFSVFFCITEKRKKLLFFPALALIFLFLIKGINPPLGNVFIFFQENIPLFKQVFRWVSSKLGEVYLITLTISSVLGIVLLWKFLKSFLKKKTVKIIGIISLIMFISVNLFYASYLFTNDLYPQELLTDIPQEYFSLGKYLEEHDSVGRIYYAPPSNDNYFREYDWGFYGSQFISYIIPNPVMDISLAIGSQIGEEAMLNIQNIFHAGNYDKFEKLMKKYDVRYVLLDRNLVSEGFTYNIDWKIANKIVSNYEKIWEEGDLELYTVPENEKNEYVENLGVISNFAGQFFVREDPVSPTINPLFSNLSNVSVEGNKLKGNLKYDGDNTFVISNIRDVNWGMLPTGIRILKSKLIVYPSSPALSEYNIETPKKIWDASNFSYVLLNKNVFSYDDLSKSDVYISDPYDSVLGVYGIKDSDFKLVDLTKALSRSTGYNCRNEDIVKDIKVEVQEGSSGFSLSGEGIPCVYQDLNLKDDGKYAFKVRINWESAKEDIIGFCLYSQKEQRCLNRDKYLYTNNLAENKEFLIPAVGLGEDKISLIIYALNIKGDKPAEVFLRNVSVEYAMISDRLDKISQIDEWRYSRFELENGKEYQLTIPILIGEKSYYYNSDNFVWEVSPSTQEDIYEISLKGGMRQKVKDQTLVQSNNLFLTDPYEEYLVFWSGKNVVNIPAEMCLSYKGSNECWLKDILTGKTYTNILESASVSNRLDAIYQSVSYKNETENILENFGIMRIPSIWGEIQISPYSNLLYKEYQMSPLCKSSVCNIYKISKEEAPDGNILAVIPQSVSSGWVGITLDKGRISLLDSKVSINGWKQGWDLSNENYDMLYVIYWPNLLGYIGYILIIVELIILVINLFKEKAYD